MRQIFVDLDGVLADFDTHFEHVFGYRNDINAPAPDGFWDKLTAHADGHFYAELPLMPKARAFWAEIETLCQSSSPIVLTGIPYSMPHAESDKRAWVARHIGPDVRVICCASKDKCMYGKPGDILIDDWQKYQSLWEAMGGYFILYTTAAKSIDDTRRLLMTVGDLSSINCGCDPGLVVNGVVVGHKCEQHR